MSKIFGTIFPFVESHDTSLRLGRFVVNYEFLKALLNYGTFDEFHLYCLNPAHFQQTVSKLSADTSINNGGSGAVRVSLRGLGSSRTLVLLNGRRHVASGTGANSSVIRRTGFKCRGH